MKAGFALVLAVTLIGCKAEPGDESTGTDGAATSTTTTGTATTAEPTSEPPPTGTTTEAATTSTTSTTTGVDEADCADYCADILTTCEGANAQYPGAASCERACSSFPAGARGDVAGNSYACRRYHTDAAADDAPTHCVHAGPGGAGACGDNCEGFCSIAVAVCPTEHPTVDACLAACTGFTDDEKFDIGDAAGDTLACRLYHLTVAATSEADAAVHCPHTLQDSPVCM